MWMAMAHFVRRSSANREYLDLEIERFAGQRVLRIDEHSIALDAIDPNRCMFAVWPLGHELHAGGELHVGRKCRERHWLRRQIFALTVAVFRLHSHFAGKANGLAG